MTRYLLKRTLPDGTEKAHSPLNTLREVEFAATYVLIDNSRVPRGDARNFAHALIRQPVGTAVPHAASGYTFCVETVAEAI